MLINYKGLPTRMCEEPSVTSVQGLSSLHVQPPKTVMLMIPKGNIGLIIHFTVFLLYPTKATEPGIHPILWDLVLRQYYT